MSALRTALRATFTMGPQDAREPNVLVPSGSPTPLFPSTVGSYRILRLIGAGGMGAVYEAEQEQPRRTVALKVIKTGFASPELLRRFEQESLALGRLQHPGIAQIYEARTADTECGPQPYFGMAFICGQSLRDYAEAHHLNTRQRLEIMAKVCDAVQHVHQRGIIYRDLKPGNIFVDGIGQPKVLDFGVADCDAVATRQTDAGQLVGTLAYMSHMMSLWNTTRAKPAAQGSGDCILRGRWDRAPEPEVQATRGVPEGS